MGNSRITRSPKITQIILVSSLSHISSVPRNTLDIFISIRHSKMNLLFQFNKTVSSKLRNVAQVFHAPESGIVTNTHAVSQKMLTII